MRSTLLLLGALLASAVPSLSQTGTQTGAQTEQTVDARRARILEIAESYRTLEWNARPEHLFHGDDARGVPVDTPDAVFRAGGWIPEAANVGVPYQWGGFCTLVEFQRGLTEGKYAGHWPRDVQDLRRSQSAVGVDCSGFLSRCWGLAEKQSTRSLGALCYELESWDDLLPGDLINNYDGHAVLFLERTDADHVRVVEATWPRVKETAYAIADMERAKMKPLRYKPLDPRWPQVDALDPTFETETEIGQWRVATHPRERRVAEPAWEGAEPGEWARYTVRTAGGAALPRSVTRTLARVADDELEVLIHVANAEGRIERTDTRDPGAALAEALFAFARRGQPLDRRERGKISVSPGVYDLDGRAFKALRVRVSFTGAMTARGRQVPIGVELDAIVSPEVPLSGVLWAQSSSWMELDGQRHGRVESHHLTGFGRRE